jgi:hypothetical protein
MTPCGVPDMKSNAVAAMMAEDAAKPPPKDRLEKLRDAVRELREVEFQRKSLEERQAELGTRMYELKTKTIVELFDLAKVTSIGVPAEGNLPAYELEVGWDYKANLSNVPEEELPKSIAWIRKTDPDLLKTTFTIDFGLKEGKKMKAFEAMLKKQKISYSTKFGVPWNTLTAWLKQQIEVKRASPPLKLLGATVERTAKLVKEKAARKTTATTEKRK